MNFQERLKELLEIRGLKYNTLSQKTGIPVTTLSNYINRGSSPTITQLSILADFFNVSIDYLIGREDDFGNLVSADSSLTTEEWELVRSYRNCDRLDKEKLISDAKYYENRRFNEKQLKRGNV